ncbi:MAG: hypothetical protein ACE5KM_15105, partial [Planctomycetaceae bacterium]
MSGCHVQIAFGPSKHEDPTRPVAAPQAEVAARSTGNASGLPASRPRNDAPDQSASTGRILAGTADSPPVSGGSRLTAGPKGRERRPAIQAAGLKSLTPAPDSSAAPPAILLDATETFEGDGKSGWQQPKPLPRDESTESSGETIAELDLAGVLYLAGAESWMVHLAAERVREAEADLDAAEAMWLPSLNAGVGWTKHDGQIQDTGGRVIDVS